ncbi:MAG: hypothetical protein KA792_03805 [Bacteroidales bacterium]|nr:hypothetical protein [Bacteroidales bacterium]
MKYSVVAISYILLLAVFLFSFNYCKKDEKIKIPTIYLKIKKNYVNKDTVIKTGSQFYFGIIAQKGTENITNLIIKLNNKTFLDTGMNVEALNYDKLVIKGVEKTDNWLIKVIDKRGLQASVALIITKDSNSVYGEINTISSLKLGAQNNTTLGAFYSFNANKIYFIDEAFKNQKLIDLIYYYDEFDKNTIASPGANITTAFTEGSSALTNWNIRNETRYINININSDLFDKINNDSMLIAAYDEYNAKRKAKMLASNDIYSFRTSTLKYGIFKVHFVDATTSGNIVIDVKIQK